MGAEDHRRSRQTKRDAWIISALFLGLALLLAAGGTRYYRHEVRRIADEKYYELKAIAGLKTSQIAAWRSERLADVRLHATGSFLSRSIPQWLGNRSDVALKNDMLRRMRQVGAIEGYDNVIISGLDGSVLLTLNPALTHLDPNTKKLVSHSARSRTAVLGDFFRCGVCKGIHFDALAPVSDTPEARPSAVLILRSNSPDQVYSLIQSWPLPSSSAESTLIRRDGDHIIHLNDLRHRQNAALMLRIPLSMTALPSVQAVLGREGRFEGKDYRGVPVMADLRKVPDSPWHLVAKVDADEILAAVSSRAWTVFLFVTLLILLAAASAGFLFHFRRRGLYKELYGAERDRRETLEEFRATLYSIGDAVITTDVSASVRRMNPIAEELTGWSEAEARGRPVSEVFRIVNEETRREVDSPVARVLREGAIVGLANHTMLVSRDGTERPIADSGAPIRNDRDDITGVVLVFRDQTEERRAAAKTAWLSSLLERTRNEIYVFDESTLRFVYVNRATQENLGYTMEEMREMTPLDIKPSFTRDTFQTLIAPLLAGEQNLVQFETVHRRKNGTDYDVMITLQMMEGEQGRQFVAIALDNTAHRKLEEQLRQAQKMEAVGQLAGGVAHDFNNMLTAIIGYAHLALIKAAGDDSLRHSVEQIIESSNRAAALTQSLLTFSRKQVVNLTRLDMNVLLQRFEKFIRRILREDIALTTVCAATPVSVLADAGQIEQVIMNLVTNARDAMPRGGSVTIETKLAALDAAFVAAHGYGAPGEYALLAVSDTGSGMDEQTRLRIFDPFFTTKEVGKGTGLGLAMVYGIVKKHEGFINVYSEPGAGTTFRIYLPAAHDAAVHEVRRPEETAIRGGTETILVAEDDDALRKLAVTVLTNFGYTVIEAADGEEAVRKFSENRDRISLVLLDGIMPRKNGKEAYAEIAALRPEVKAVFASGYAEDVFTKDGIPDRAAAFIQKPMPPSELLRKVREALDS